MRLRFLLSGVAALAMLPASTYAADVTVGTVNVTGHVTASCNVTKGLTGTIDLAELDDTSTGFLSGTLTGTTTAPNGYGSPTNVTGRVVCNGTAPIFHLSATQLFQGDVSPPTGYTARVNYVAHLQVTEADGDKPTQLYTTTDTPTAATNLTLTGRIAGGSTDNIAVWVDGLTTGAGLVLETGEYNSGTPAITVTVTPS